jgi:hypothetical protein
MGVDNCSNPSFLPCTPLHSPPCFLSNKQIQWPLLPLSRHLNLLLPYFPTLPVLLPLPFLATRSLRELKCRYAHTQTDKSWGKMKATTGIYSTHSVPILLGIYSIPRNHRHKMICRQTLSIELYLTIETGHLILKDNKSSDTP